jgi:hypothetical protein
MRTPRIWILALALLLLPNLAVAAPRQVSLGEYERTLQQASAQLEVARWAASSSTGREAIAAARALLAEGFVVDTPAGPVNADMGHVVTLLDQANPTMGTGRPPLDQALVYLQEQAKAADAFQSMELRAVPDARERLEEALAASRTQARWYERLAAWLDGLFGGEERQQATETVVDTNVWVLWAVGLVIGIGGAFVLGRALLSLGGHGGGPDALVRDGKAVRLDRPLTPEELRAEGRRLAAAGDYKEGLRLAHLALLQQFDRLGLLRYVPAYTNREHEWALRRSHPDLARTLHALNDLVEARLYSGHGASADDFSRGDNLVEQLWREGDAISKRAHEATGA